MEKKLLPNDEAAMVAQKEALEELERFNRFLASMGQPPVSFLERPALITYIKCAKLGLLNG